ncbi:MAG: hypothetical protein ACFCBU_03480 [Cyanophyceae cyanobacterium]
MSSFDLAARLDVTGFLVPLPDWVPFIVEVSGEAIAGVCLWSLALYLGLSPLGEWVIDQIIRWFDFAERSLYATEEEYERTRDNREAQNAFYASIFSIFPFFLAGIGANWFVARSLGSGCTVSVCLLALMSCGVYELGRRTGKAEGDS